MIYVYNNMNGGSNYRGGIISSVFSIIIGALITLLSIFAFEEMVDIVFFMIGIGIIISNIFPLVASLQAVRVDSRYIFNLVASIIGIVLGILFMFNHSLVISIVFGVYLVIMPVVRIILSENWLNQLKSEIPLFIAAILLFCNVLDTVLKIGLIIVGSIIMILGIVNLTLELIYRHKHKDDNNDIFNGQGPTNKSFNKDDGIVIDAEVKDLD